ncbi:hypothetical protein CCZ01_04365 [Helicobacter monodelphidis]|uniref:flagellar hook-basal body complex protein n=1 Tax=Helicobacter sp. 15-1451 TaxID=2004995 RepID=UPI000DCB1DDC|nr:flagellar hook-basal body complex protein [Helicobacter sp. 15-1451]RAX58046.1 hypothetical protein CCZ01_04365 [Helicobacter sp. 15-1451]
MNSTLFNGVAGILTHQVGLDVTSNNIANANTVGYRGNEAHFKSMLSKNMGILNANSPLNNDYNHGTTTASTAIITRPGTIKASTGEFDVAMNGRGWFVVGTQKDGNYDVKNPIGQNLDQKNFYTRDGSFGRDSDGYLVNNSGYYLYGINLGKIGADGVFNASNDYDADIAGLTGSQLEPIQIPEDLYFRPNITTTLSMGFNLNRTENSKGIDEAFADIDGTIDYDAIFEQNMNAFTSGSDPIDVKVNKTFTMNVDTPNPDYDPNQPAGDDNPEFITENFTFTYGGEDEFGFNTLGELRDLVNQHSGLTLDLQRKDDGMLDGCGLVLKNETDADIKVAIGGRLGDVLGFKNVDRTFEPIEENDSSSEITGKSVIGSSLGVPTNGFSQRIFDDQGNVYTIQNQFYLKQASNGEGTDEIWEVKTSIMTADGKSYLSDNYTQSELKFSNGNVVDAPDVTVPFLTGDLTMNLGGADGRTSTSFAGNASELRKVEQDGIAAGRLSEVTITEQGFINLTFSNGASEIMGRVGTVAFVNDQGLQKVGNNMFALDAKIINGEIGIVSGPPIMGWDEENATLKFASMRHKYLEYSNVDIAEALTNLIVFQRGYSFNAKAFTTGDELIKEAIGLKR